MTYAVTRAADPDAAYPKILDLLLAFNAGVMGEAGGTPFALVINAPGSDEVKGGLWALSLWGSFYIALVIAPDDGRGQGLGRQMMLAAEAEARRLSGPAVLREPRLRSLRPDRRPRPGIPEVFHEEGVGSLGHLLCSWSAWNCSFLT